MNLYQCWFNGKQVQLKAETLYDAKQKAVDYFKAGKKHHMVTVILIAKGDTPVATDPSSL